MTFSICNLGLCACSRREYYGADMLAPHECVLQCSLTLHAWCRVRLGSARILVDGCAESWQSKYAWQSKCAYIFGKSRDGLLGAGAWQGRLISTYVNSPNNRYNKAVADLGLNCYLKMLLKDNFIHADLHPGTLPCPNNLRTPLVGAQQVEDPVFAVEVLGLGGRPGAELLPEDAAEGQLHPRRPAPRHAALRNCFQKR